MEIKNWILENKYALMIGAVFGFIIGKIGIVALIIMGIIYFVYIILENRREDHAIKSKPKDIWR